MSVLLHHLLHRFRADLWESISFWQEPYPARWAIDEEGRTVHQECLEAKWEAEKPPTPQRG